METFNEDLKMELIEKLNQLENNFKTDLEIIDLVDKLKNRFNTLYSETFSNDDIESDEFEEMCDEYYSQLRDNDPDDTSIFQVIWFK